MAEQNFIDYVKVFCRSGNGGSGSSHFRREKFVAKGGPDGGDGGRGGHIILRGNAQLWTLLHLRYKKHIHADNGKNGSKARSTGADGEDIIIDVPLGTIARDIDTGEQILEITEDGKEVVLMRGGKGGLGNWHFRSATNQAPSYSQPGMEGRESWVILELKVLADVGLVGFPNAGKSTLLASITAAKPEIANYAFTTLRPNLGIVSYKDHLSFVMADIPGIIEGASEGKGLGLRFLRHIERNSCLLFMISSESPNIAKEYKVLLKELEKYNKELLSKDRILAITKSDLVDDELQKLLLTEFKKSVKEKIEIVFISAMTSKNINSLKDKLWNIIHRE
ncbi:MAG: GTPase ObgE [Bacteroidetes bacterium]|nr:GTPase ObgE [Bacteroidota bacterium]